MSPFDGPFALNPGAQVKVEEILPGCPALIIDDFYRDPDAVRAMALRGRYDASLAYYPGLHSNISARDLTPFFDTLTAVLHKLGVTDLDARGFYSDFSVVTTPASEMLAAQKHPHVDGVPMASIVYLTPGSEIGTSFFRHLPTGYALLRTPEENAAYTAWLETYGEQVQPQTYAVEMDGIWQRLHTVAGRYNRMALYSGNVFHSIDMRDVVTGHSMETARLTQRIFMRGPNPNAAG